MNEKRDHLELDVKDFGPIAKAKVELRPLTVFVGPSNTGKSYLAVLIYALHRFYGGDGRHIGGFPLLWRGNKKIIDKSMEHLIDFFQFLGNEKEKSKKTEVPLSPPLIEFLQFGASKSGELLAGEIRRCFGVGEIDSLIRRQGSSDKVQVVIRRPIPNHCETVEHSLTLARNSKFQVKVPDNLQIAVDLETDYRAEYYYTSQLISEMKKDSAKRNFFISELVESLVSMIMPSILGSLHFPAYYLPADRTGIMHAHNVVVTALISSASSAGLRPATRISMLSGVLADFLEQFIEIGSVDVRRKKAIDHGESIEKQILGGSIGIQKESHGNYPHFIYRPDDWQDDLALANASSMVSELAPVVLYLRHIVKPGNVLIVEEPESHLHPAMQVEFMRQLSALVNAGIKVIVTTHSEWLLEELANIVRRSESPKLEYDTVAGSQIALRPDQVGAWLFEPKNRPKGSVVKEIFPGDSGIYPSGYDDVAAALHNDWAEMSSEIEAACE